MLVWIQIQRITAFCYQYLKSIPFHIIEASLPLANFNKYLESVIILSLLSYNLMFLLGTVICLRWPVNSVAFIACLKADLSSLF